VRHEGSFAGDSSSAAFDNIAGRDPTPEEAAQAAEQFRRLLDALNDEKLRAVALAKMEGCTNEEIAKRIKRSVPNVELKLKIIRTRWEKEMAR
jgi:DNA-directed RNA polymerase specialized sigma24 family protein